MRNIVDSKTPLLREKTAEISIADITTPHIQKLIAEMSALLAKEKYGVALAAPQVGESLRLFIVSGRALARGSRSAPDESKHSEVTPRGNEPDKKIENDVPPPPDLVYINPVISKLSKAKSNKHEGCLSIRGKWGTVPRAEKATITAYDEHGKKVTRGASGFLAHIFQHEMDHLEGILYIDKAVELYDEEKEKK